MANFTIEWMENKSKDWIVATLKEGNQTITEVSINRTNKKGETFPNFDGITLGGEVEGELWKSPAGKNYLFAPRPQSAPRGGAGIKQAMETKNKNINHIVDRKDNSIVLSATFRDATILTQVSTNSGDAGNYTTTEIKQIWLDWRKWLLEQFGDPSDIKETKQPF